MEIKQHILPMLHKGLLTITVLILTQLKSHSLTEIICPWREKVMGEKNSPKTPEESHILKRKQPPEQDTN